MDIVALLADKSTKSAQKREQICQALENTVITAREIRTYAFDDSSVCTILEAMEAVSRSKPGIADIEWLNYAGERLSSMSNAVKREASRVVGNIAHLFSDEIGKLADVLIENTKNGGTVVRWGSAYALGRIVGIPEFANGQLFDVLAGLAERETENGVKNQYLNGLKKAKQLRK